MDELKAFKSEIVGTCATVLANFTRGTVICNACAYDVCDGQPICEHHLHIHNESQGAG